MFQHSKRLSVAMAVAMDIVASDRLPARASDGVIEINQSCAAQMGASANDDPGCMPGDTDGFPVTITVSGSYRLTGHLDLSSAGSNGIEIQSNLDDVTIDLNGFSISGGTGSGIYADEYSENITVTNGIVRGMGGDGIALAGAGARVDRIRAIGNAGNGINLGADCAVTDSTARLNILTGINITATCGGLGNVSQGNGSQYNMPLPTLALIDTDQLQDDSVTTPKLVPDAVRGSTVEDNSLSLADVRFDTQTFYRSQGSSTTFTTPTRWRACALSYIEPASSGWSCGVTKADALDPEGYALWKVYVGYGAADCGMICFGLRP